MTCAWKEFLGILPLWLRPQVDKLGRESCQELRLRLEEKPELVLAGEQRWLEQRVTREDLSQCVNNASRYSPWNAVTASQGYLTAPGGHRIGMCGNAVVKDGVMSGIREVRSLCIRVARDFPGIAADGAAMGRSVVIIGPPGWGKTTLLRDLIRSLSEQGSHVAVVDERGELFPVEGGFVQGKCTDVLTGCGKTEAIETVLRTMGPDWIAVDEITAKADCDALIRAGNCGVKLAATAHAGSLEEFRSRSVYRPLIDSGLFKYAMVLQADKSWKWERMAR